MLHHVWVQFPDETTWSTFVEANDEELEKLAERLAFYKDHGTLKNWQTSRVAREHGFDSFKRALDSRIDPKTKGVKARDKDWPYDWPKPEL